MSPAPRFQAEFMIRQNITEIEAFAEVFSQRIGLLRQDSTCEKQPNIRAAGD